MKQSGAASRERELATCRVNFAHLGQCRGALTGRHWAVVVIALFSGLLILSGCGTGTTAKSSSTAVPVDEVRVPMAQAELDVSQSFGKKQPAEASHIAQNLNGFFGTKPSGLKTGVIVFPITDDHGATRFDGLGLSYQALIAISRMSSESPVSVYPDTALEMFVDSGCDRPGRMLTSELRKACTQAVAAQLSVSGALIQRGAEWDLNVEFFDAEGKSSGKPLKHTLPAGQLNLVPGLIAGDICEHLKVKPSDAARTFMHQPQVDSDEASAVLTRLLKDPLQTIDSHVHAERFLKSNPQCVGAWRRVLAVTSDPFQAVKWLRNCDHPPKDARLELSIAARLSKMGYGKHSFADLQRVSALLGTDPAVGLALLQLAAQSGDPSLVDRVVETWRERDLAYLARLARGRFLLEQANGTHSSASQSHDKAAEFSELQRRQLDGARSELQAAVAANPLGWQAHTQLISVATALNLPREEMERHFAAAIAVSPDNISAYRRKLVYLSPHQRGTVEDMAGFAEECVATGRWEAGIPQLMIEAVDLAVCDPATAATSFARFHNEQLWQAIQAYHKSAEQLPDGPDKAQAISYYCLWGCNAGHLTDVAPLFSQFKQDYYLERHDAAVFQTPMTYEYWRHLVNVATNPATEDARGDLRSSIQLAFDEGDIDRVETLEQYYGFRPDGTKLEVNDVTIALAIGRKLRADRRVELSSEELRRVVFHEGPSGFGSPIVPESNGFRWAVADAPGELHGVFPIGILHGVVSGRMKLSRNFQRAAIHLHVRALRDVITVNYLPREERISVMRSNRELASHPLKDGVIPFRFEFGASEDILEPAPGFILRVPVLDHVRSTFAFEAEGGNKEVSSFTLTDLKVELRE